jgi:cytochrome P450
MRNYEPFMARTLEEYGPIVLINLPKTHTVLTNHAPFVQEMMRRPEDFPRMERARRLVGQLLGDNIVTAEGEPWRKMREMMSPPFRAKHVQAMVTGMQAEVMAMLGRWQGAITTQAPLEMNYELGRLALSILGRTMLGLGSVGEEAAMMGKALTETMTQVFEDSHSLFVWRLPPTPRNLRFWYWRQKLYQLVDAIIDRRRHELEKLPTGEDGPTDLLSIMLRASEGEGLSTVELRGQLLTMLLAGHETTATALTWTLFHISANYEVYERLVEESAVVTTEGLTVEAMRNLGFTERVIKESMRMDPPVPLLARQTVADVQLGDYKVPARTIMMLPIRLIHNNPHFWEEPTQFQPDRFLQPLVPGSYLPFVLGPHTCLGMNFAMTEMKAVLSLILNHGYHFEMVHPGQPDVPVGPFRKPKSLWMYVTRRF